MPRLGQAFGIPVKEEVQLIVSAIQGFMTERGRDSSIKTIVLVYEDGTTAAKVQTCLKK